MIRRLLQPSSELLDDPSPGTIAKTAGLAALALAVYGFTTGFWRSPVMGCYVAIKMPLLVACTLGCNGMLNGLLGILLGGVGFKESMLALLSAFASAALILGSLAPVTFMLALDAPPPDSPYASSAHAGYLLFHVALIAIAGIAGTLSLFKILLQRCPSRRVAMTTMFAWLAGNGFLGAQFSWILRPFFGTPTLEVAFLRPDPMHGSFYEAVWRSLDRVTRGAALPFSLASILTLLLLVPYFYRLSQQRPRPIRP
ncbi:hypothetical protein OJ996_17070 [Luteolibacter sp. GHJ8]|uniref:Uncharacterized protein n=1 Tax=Luteolibacter rhizosphaerae TaxID=2989719 RepID=A0ABT3G659_9BACT|nr:hypothetical protein [Luteolibacter rhizosphaerae]MCW1915300.1 hypothetical protein [Luteolibacter rhizosphaerae]